MSFLCRFGLHRWMMEDGPAGRRPVKWGQPYSYEYGRYCTRGQHTEFVRARSFVRWTPAAEPRWDEPPV
jgi:hypothetical protein